MSIENTSPPLTGLREFRMTRSGETVKLAYADQSRTLDSENSVFEEISGGSDSMTVGGRT